MPTIISAGTSAGRIKLVPVREKLLQASYEPGTMSPEEYAAMIDRELKLWGDVVQETGVRVKA